jgi:hypothetical protein
MEGDIHTAAIRMDAPGDVYSVAEVPQMDPLGNDPGTGSRLIGVGPRFGILLPNESVEYRFAVFVRRHRHAFCAVSAVAAGIPECAHVVRGGH